jgi:hypothetical protein
MLPLRTPIDLNFLYVEYSLDGYRPLVGADGEL